MIYGIALFTLRVSVVIIDTLGFRVITVFDAHGAVLSINVPLGCLVLSYYDLL